MSDDHGSSEVLVDIAERVATITINRPERRNALNGNVLVRLEESFECFSHDERVSAIVLTGAQGNFCAGADLGSSFAGEQSFVEQHEGRGHFARVMAKMNACKRPILAAIQGYCLAGGMGLCLSSDIVIASEDARFGLPEIKRGLWPYMVTAALIRNVGRKKALELCMLGERIAAAEAERMGFINYCVPADQFESRVQDMASRLAAFSPAVMGLGKSSFYRIADMVFDDALAYLQSQLTINTQCEDLMEGIAAFMEKREPQWKNR